MEAKSSNQIKEESNDSNYDRKAEIKAFDDSKTGVKGLVDSGVKKINLCLMAKSYESDEESKT